MALKIRLTRLGDKGNPFYRVVVADSKSPRDGKFVQILGTYDPKGTMPDAIKIDKAIALDWVAKGAEPTETARVVLEKAGVLAKEKKAKISKPKVKQDKKQDKKKEK
jgi:small subunit ribosomal protein S16